MGSSQRAGDTINSTAQPTFSDDASSYNGGLDEIAPENIRNAIITKAPEKRFRLGTWSVIGLVVNRVIGTGIFNSPKTVMEGTGSQGVTLIFWFIGALHTIAGMYLSIELGLTIPRYDVDGVNIGVPRSGGTLNYLQYIYDRPAYRPGTFRLITCIFATAYIIVGNMAGNCLVFGARAWEAAGNKSSDPDSYATIRGIAVGVATFACFVHTVSRRGGIWLGNLLAVLKVLILLLIIVTGILAWAGVFDTKTYAIENMTADMAFDDPSDDSFGYVKAFLAVIFAWSGFDQPNYVLGEIGRPHKKFPRGMKIGVAILCFLYMLVNVAYMVVVPKEVQLTKNVAVQFFAMTLGTKGGEGGVSPERVMNAFMAISSFGNIMVMTFTAARVKQEIAKEGVLPWRKFFGSNKNISIGRVLEKIQRKDSFITRNFNWLLRQKWMHPREHSQETPAGALFLHWSFTILMILSTIKLSPTDAYNFLVSLYSYATVAIFGVLIGVGVLKLRFSAREKWRKKAADFKPFLSILSATVFSLLYAYPIIASWVPPTGEWASKHEEKVPWFTVPTVAWSILAFGVVWYGGFNAYARRRLRKDNSEFRVEKVPEFDRDPQPDGPHVQVNEIVYLAWIAKEAELPTSHMESQSTIESF